MSALLSLLRGGKQPVVGMVQLAALAGGSRYRGGAIEDVLSDALEEAEILAAHGVDALMVQNLGDIPTDRRVTTAQTAWMTRIVSEVRRRTGKPTGLNMLENDAEAMMAVASATQADFVRIKIYVGAMVTPFGVESAQAFAAIKARTSWSADDVAILADVHDRTGNPLVAGTLVDDLDAAVRLGAADALVLTGKTYPGTKDLIETAREVIGKTPILVGGGVTAKNIREVQAFADGVIVSSSLKGEGTAFGRLDAAKVEEFMAAARAA
jgi:membrane complex biogenesis BtpA family protein